VKIPLTSMLAVIGKQLGLPGFAGAALTPEQTAVVWYNQDAADIGRTFSGAALGVSGAVMQGVFGNPLADPGIIGVSAGASLGAVIAVALGLTTISLYYMPLFALIGALLAVGLTVALTMRDGKIPVMTLLLAGVAISMLLSAMTLGILTL